ncbi:MAG: hypothetical protein KBS41_06090 [Oscillospiraceae bacterium]|nr:hypothetical protein [Candidatus Equicaccousia limihippi]
MAKLTYKIVCCKNGIYIFYGIKTARRHYREISTDRKAVQNLIEALNRDDITEQDLPLFIEEILS